MQRCHLALKMTHCSKVCPITVTHCLPHRGLGASASTVKYPARENASGGSQRWREVPFRL